MQYVNHQWGWFFFFSCCFTVSLCLIADRPNKFCKWKGYSIWPYNDTQRWALVPLKGESCLLQNHSSPFQHCWSMNNKIALPFFSRSISESFPHNGLVTAFVSFWACSFSHGLSSLAWIQRHVGKGVGVGEEGRGWFGMGPGRKVD